MTKNRTLILVGLAVLVIFAGLFVWVNRPLAKFQGHHALLLGQIIGDEDRPFLRQFFLEQIKSRISLAENLNLTEEQKLQIKEFLTERREIIIPVIADVIEKREDLGELVFAKTTDEAAIRQASTALAKTIENAAILTSSLGQEVRTILSPEQFDMIDQYRVLKRECLSELMEHLLRPLNEE